MTGTLYLCGLPIGNPLDISERIRTTLAQVDCVAAEDTRKAAQLLSAYGIGKPIISYHDFSEQQKKEIVIYELLSGKNIALLSDAGMPVISDPGYHLIRAAREAKIPIIAIPGPTAVTTAVALSGLPSDRFCFEGFLENKQNARQGQLKELVQEQRTLVFYEAPHRLVEMLTDCLEILGERQCFIGRELTKKYEEQISGTITQALERFTKREPKGEFVVVMAGAKNQPAEVGEYQKLIQLLQEKGLSQKDIIEVVHDGLNVPKNELKAMFYQ
jgi:16S rRNA (cytidine1402-2'-O)-methyltransferase